MKLHKALSTIRDTYARTMPAVESLTPWANNQIRALVPLYIINTVVILFQT